MTKKIITLHPDGKKGVNIDYEKYTIIKDAILELVSTHKNITFKLLTDTLVLNLQDTFEGSVPWYTISVKLDLEARHIIERIPGTSPQQIRLIEKTQS